MTFADEISRNSWLIVTGVFGQWREPEIESHTQKTEINKHRYRKEKSEKKQRSKRKKMDLLESTRDEWRTI